MEALQSVDTRFQVPHSIQREHNENNIAQGLYITLALHRLPLICFTSLIALCWMSCAGEASSENMSCMIRQG